MRTLWIVAASTILVTAAARADEVRVELNRLEPLEDACRAYVVAVNDTETAFAELRLDLVLFDTGHIVSRRLAVELAPLPAAKESLKVFDIDGVACPEIGRALVNDVLACADGGGAREDCLALISPTSRATPPLVK